MEHLSQKYNWKVAFITPEWPKHNFGFDIIDAGPEEFLYLINNANLVCTNSFHGTAFSIIFEKKFFSVNDYINGEYVDDERIRNILGEIGIPERYIKEEDIQNLDFQKEIDYTDVTGKRLELAENAIKDMTKAIED